MLCNGLKAARIIPKADDVAWYKSLGEPRELWKGSTIQYMPLKRGFKNDSQSENSSMSNFGV